MHVTWNGFFHTCAGLLIVALSSVLLCTRHLPSLPPQVCDDINECMESENGGCSPFRNCTNTAGSYFCGPCRTGYTEQGTHGCILTNPCQAGQHNCERNEYCHNPAPGAYYCECPQGFIGNGLQCSPDVDLDGYPSTALTIGCDSPPCVVVSGGPWPSLCVCGDTNASPTHCTTSSSVLFVVDTGFHWNATNVPHL